MAIVKNQYGIFETDKTIGGKRLPSSPELDNIAQKLFGKNFDDLTINQRARTGLKDPKRPIGEIGRAHV